MKVKELKKIYNYDQEQEAFILDVQLEDYRDAYSEWDYSPFSNRDLDEDLCEYLLDCSYEISIKNKLDIDFHILNQDQNTSREKKMRIGMQNYFMYQIRKLENQKLRIIKDIVRYLILGGSLLVLGSYVKQFKSNFFMINILSEGFLIGGWVMLWEMFSAWFFDMKKINMKASHFDRLFQANIKFSYRNPLNGRE